MRARDKLYKELALEKDPNKKMKSLRIINATETRLLTLLELAKGTIIRTTLRSTDHEKNLGWHTKHNKRYKKNISESK